MNKHTNGPWSVSIDDHGEFGIVAGNMYITYAFPNGEYDIDGEVHFTESMANARLIAAAPELLEALERIVNAGAWYRSALEIDVYDGYDGESLVASARAAIAKARGEA